ncbi:hypothetical protein KW496_19530 [Vibrio fluvialis]|nr:hypothetical protein [Vibrio fluvialis]
MFEETKLYKELKNEFPFENLFVEQTIHLYSEEQYQKEYIEYVESGSELIYEKELCNDEDSEWLYDSKEKKETKYKSDLNVDMINLFFCLKHREDELFYIYCRAKIESIYVLSKIDDIKDEWRYQLFIK